MPARPELAVGHSMGGMVLAVAADRLGAGHAAYLDIGLTTGPSRAADHVSSAERLRLSAVGVTVHAIEGGRHTLMYGWHDELLAALPEDPPADLHGGGATGPS